MTSETLFRNVTEGGKASEYYSIAKELPRGTLRKKMLREVLVMIDNILTQSIKNDTGFRLIRGNALLQLGRAREAVAEFQRALDLRAQREASMGELGEALADLGYGLVRMGAIRQGREKLEKGVELLEKANRWRFEVRARVKLAVCYFWMFRINRGWEQLAKAHETAHTHSLRGFLQRPLARFLRLARMTSGEPM